MDVAEVVHAERVRSIPNEISSIDRRIGYLKGRKKFLMEMRKNWNHTHPHDKVDEEDDESASSDGPSPPPPRKKPKKSIKKKKKRKKSKVEEHRFEGKTLEEHLADDCAAAGGASLPPLTPRYPDFPEGSDSDDVRAYVKERARVMELNAPLDNLPTLSRRGHKDPATATAVVATDDKRMLLRVADAVVSISFAFYDPESYPNRDPNLYCTGFIISCDKVNKKARILTCDYMVSNEDDTKQKAQVRWAYMEDTILEAELLFFSKYYKVALLEIPMDVPVEIPPFGSYPSYGHEVFALALDKELSLMARRGTIAWLQETLNDFCHQAHHCLFVDYELPHCGAGGPVVDRNGDVVGMSFHLGKGRSAVLSIATALSCVDMWTNFSGEWLHPSYCRRIPRPLIGMSLKNVNILDKLSGTGICDFIVDVVNTDSTAWKLGIRDGDVIAFDGHCYTPVPKFEDFLLTRGLAYLHGAPAEVDFKLEAHHPGEDFKRSITLRVPFSDVSHDLPQW